MSRIQAEIVSAYPALGEKSSTLHISEMSDSRLMAELASHVVERFDAGHPDDILAAFALAERLIAGGSEAERHAAIVGFLETVQNVASHRTFGAAVFEQFLGPNSRTAWNELEEIWRGKSSLAEVVASETGTSIRRPWWQFWRKRKDRSPRELLDQVENPELRKIIEQITRE